MQDIQLSIIVPIYNVEPFLRKCVHSLEQQDLAAERYEVILVNDGSTDHSGEICTELAKQYENIKVIEQENQGVSAARNTGMDAARGKYMMFVDPDDYIETNVIGRVVEVTERNQAELCFFLAEAFNEHASWPTVHQPFAYNQVYTGEYIMLHGIAVSTVWMTLYLTEFLKQTEVRFQRAVSGEDVEFCMMLYPQAHRILFTDILVYHYNCSFSYPSLMRNKDVAKHRQTLLSTVEIVNDIFRYCESAPVSKGIQRLYRRRMRSTLVSAILTAYKDHQYYDRAFLHTLLDRARDYRLYPIWGRTESWKTTLLLPFINLLRFL
jgi:glycosyltransferase involved in cell wall biosynthesis